MEHPEGNLDLVVEDQNDIQTAKEDEYVLYHRQDAIDQWVVQQKNMEAIFERQQRLASHVDSSLEKFSKLLETSEKICDKLNTGTSDKQVLGTLAQPQDMSDNPSGTGHHTPLSDTPQRLRQKRSNPAPAIDTSPHKKTKGSYQRLSDHDDDDSLSIQASGEDFSDAERSEGVSDKESGDDLDKVLSQVDVEDKSEKQDDMFEFLQGMVDNELAPAIHTKLAPAIQKAWESELKKDKIKECVRKIKTPENCKFLVAPTVNPNLRCELAQNVRDRDARRFRQQRLLVKAATPLVQTMDVLQGLKVGSVITADTLQTLKQQAQDSFACLSHLNTDSIRARKDDILNSISSECRTYRFDKERDPEHLFTKVTNKKLLKIATGKAEKKKTKSRSSYSNRYSSSTQSSKNFKPSRKYQSSVGRSKKGPSKPTTKN